MTDLIPLFKIVAEIDSPSGEERKLADFVMSHLLNLGLNPEIDEHNMVYCKVGDNPDKLFCAHLDTVEPGRNIKVSEKDGYLVSDGTTIVGGDNKVAVASFLNALDEHIKANEKLNLELLFTVREETNSGVRDFDHKKIESKVGFIFDVGSGDLGNIVKSSPFIEDFKVTISGLSSHASIPEEGINVLEALNVFLSNMKLGRTDEHTTVNIGLINGGDATNTVPGNLILHGDIRSSTKESFLTNKNLIEEAIKKAEAETDCKLQLDWLPYAPGYVLNFSDDHYKKIEDIYNKYGVELFPDETTSGSDAAFLNSVNIKTYCLGDGVENSHRTDERVEITKLLTLKAIVSDLMLESFK